ncbi:DUF1552 domain-containing protein [Roseiconus nitratireducens]|uniref:DUF1552 domain-containing protein n=1 Tax=Roseiconus nitratireducens TaxID=2605748 RepID=A0A5M6D329_9BACT|nr:DUF1552 domain-containing protein [Roseiconus nitratireducens]KAA5539575.1 DUF1552 domain-containing protein [Roseiconus nitratireducens]
MSTAFESRRRFLRDLGVGAATMPFLAGLTSLRAEESIAPQRRKRLVVMFSPNGTLPDEFWPDEFGDQTPLKLKPMLQALEPFREQTLILKGIDNKVRGDGDNHMRGMSCLLTATELNPGNIQGGGHTPAGWAGGISIDQEVRRFFQSDDRTKTRFGSLEFGVAVPNRADPWTRMCYAGSDRPIAPIDDPGQMFEKLYGGAQDRQTVASVLDRIGDDLARVSSKLSSADRSLLQEHLESVRKLEIDIAAASGETQLLHPEPEIDPNIELVNDNTPEISRMQIELLVNALANDMTRVASLQFMRSVGQARMRWLDIQDGHHSLSHEPDGNEQAHAKLMRINQWFAGELAFLAKRLAETPEPGRPGESLLDNTQIVWLNELGKGNSHTLDNIPFLLVGGGADFRTGRALDFDGAAHNRLWLALAHGLGHRDLQTFGSAAYCEGGAIDLG